MNSAEKLVAGSIEADRMCEVIGQCIAIVRGTLKGKISNLGNQIIKRADEPFGWRILSSGIWSNNVSIECHLIISGDSGGVLYRWEGADIPTKVRLVHLQGVYDALPILIDTLLTWPYQEYVGSDWQPLFKAAERSVSA